MFSTKAAGMSVSDQWATAAIWFRPAMIPSQAVTLYHRIYIQWLSPCGMGHYDVTDWVGLDFIDAVTVELNEATAEDGTTRWQTHMRAIVPLIEPSPAASRHGTTTSLQWRLPLLMDAEHFKSQSQITPTTASELRGPSSWPRQ
jgi:hypothetical protein